MKSDSPPHPQATVTNVWLVNLAVADFIFSLSQVFAIHKKNTGHWPYGLFLCQMLGFFKYANMFCSVFLLAVISVDRVLCIWRPILMRRRRTLLAAKVGAVCVWVVSILFSSPFFFYHDVYIVKKKPSCIFNYKSISARAGMALNLHRLLNGFVLPFIVILVSYVLAAIGIKRTRLAGKYRPLCILASLVIAFFLCWAPYHILLLLRMLKWKGRIAKVMHSVASSLAYSHSCVNPVLYFCMGLETRGSVRHSLRGAYRRVLAEYINDQTFQSGPRSSDERSGSQDGAAVEATGDHFHPVVEDEAKV